MGYVTIDTAEGTLRGIETAGVNTFLGVPYGADTGGENRFLPPQPVTPWTGQRDALAFGANAPQVDTRVDTPARGQKLLTLLYPRTGWPIEGGEISEDCLKLNVWAPAGAKDLPVLVWFHGGAFTHGSGNEMAFNGDVLSSFGQMVVVTVSHRLGAFGFLDLRRHGEADSADVGLLDLVAALEWVQRNIASVGGNPDAVTICGQSGGSAKVAALNAMPAAQGLFARSIMMSGPFGDVMSPEMSGALADGVMKELGVSTVAELRALPMEALLEAQHKVLLAKPISPSAERELDAVPGFGPSMDAVHLPRNPFSPDAPDAIAGKPLMIGSCTHEMAMFMADNPAYGPDMPEDEIRAEFALTADKAPATDFDSYAKAFPHEPAYLRLARRGSDLVFGQPGLRIAQLASEKTTVFSYLFQQPTEVLGGVLGACHSLDLAYVFGTLDRVPLTGRAPERIAVSRQMMSAWAKFVHEGHPGWDAYAPDAPNTHVFGTAHGPDLSLPADIDMYQAD